MTPGDAARRAKLVELLGELFLLPHNSPAFDPMNTKLAPYADAIEALFLSGGAAGPLTATHDGTTHFPGCWREHHACAVERIERDISPDNWALRSAFVAGAAWMLHESKASDDVSDIAALRYPVSAPAAQRASDAGDAVCPHCGRAWEAGASYCTHCEGTGNPVATVDAGDAERDVRHVAQRSDWDCGIAAMAMAIGKEYDEVLAVVGDVDDAIKAKGISTYFIPRYLGMLGFSTLQRFIWQKGTAWEDWTAFSGIRLASTHHLSNTATAHFVVMRPDGVILDPARPGNHSASEYGRPFDVWQVSAAPVAAPRDAEEGK